MSQFKIAPLSAGSNPNNWDNISEILDAGEPDWSYKSFQATVILGDMTKKGVGFPSVTWTWRGLSDADRETLRAYCAELSAEIYIETPTNETTSGARDWIDAQAVMNWLDADEEKSADHTLDFQIQFTRIAEV